MDIYICWPTHRSCLYDRTNQFIVYWPSDTGLLHNGCILWRCKEKEEAHVLGCCFRALAHLAHHTLHTTHTYACTPQTLLYIVDHCHCCTTFPTWTALLSCLILHATSIQTPCINTPSLTHFTQMHLAMTSAHQHVCTCTYTHQVQNCQDVSFNSSSVSLVAVIKQLVHVHHQLNHFCLVNERR